jgi:hypothetical protein
MLDASWHTGSLASSFAMGTYQLTPFWVSWIHCSHSHRFFVQAVCTCHLNLHSFLPEGKIKTHAQVKNELNLWCSYFSLLHFETENWSIKDSQQNRANIPRV